MKFSDVETFLTIVETGSFTKAAEKLFLSQSTVSHQLKTLEEELGITLLSRQKGQRDIVLTPKGTEFLDLARRWIDLWKEMQALQGKESQTVLSIGGPRNLLTYTLPLLVKELKRIQSMKLRILSYRSAQVYAAVENREIDVGLAFEQPPQNERVVSQVLFRERMCLIRLKRDYVIRHAVNPRDLNPRDEIYFRWFPDFERWHDACWGQNVEHFIEINTSALLPTIMDDPRQWMIVPISIAKHFQTVMPIEILELQTPPPDRTCYKLTNRNPRIQDTPALEIVDSVIETFCSRLPWNE